MDVETENLVYVPKERKSTIERLIEEGYMTRGEVLMQDEFGLKVLMIGMVKQIEGE